MSGQEITLTLNGERRATPAHPGERLSAMLRERLDARDVKIGCDAGDCGACTVLVDGDPVCACLTPAHRADGRKIETVAGLLERDPLAQALEARFLKGGAAQCGICTPGMMVSATALLRQNADPTEDEIKDALGGVLCRCTGYRKILDAVHPGRDKGGDRQPDNIDPGGPGHVGEAIPRLDGRGKTRGSERFGDDVAPPGTLEIRIIRCPHDHAGFSIGDTGKFVEKTSGIVAVLTAADVPGDQDFGVIPGFRDQPVFARDTARFRGEAVAAVVGEAVCMAEFDPASFPVAWTPRPAVTDTDAATAPGAPVLHARHAGNLMCKGFVKTGDAEHALAVADIVAEGHFTSGFVEHAYIEPEAGYALPEGDGVTVHACTQAPVMDRESLAAILNLPESAVRIVPAGVGGGFGAKLDLSVQPYLALAALKTGKPVRMAYSRSESMQSTTKRHPSDIRLRIGARRDGTLSGMAFHGVFNSGAYASWGPTVANRVPVHASGPYRIGDYLAEARGIYTHGPPAGAFRGFGVPQAAIAQEALLDELAARLEIDPLEFRLKNVLENGVTTVCGQVFDQGVGIGACLRALRPAWQRERVAAANFNATASGHFRRGVGVASGWYGCGNTSLPNPSTIRCGITSKGEIVLHQGAADIGQGANTVIAQIFATALGVPVDRLRILGGDTAITPDAGKTSASRQTFVTGTAARLAGEALRAKLLARVNAARDARIDLTPEGIQIVDGSGRHSVALDPAAADDDGYVLTACETYDPPTEPLDENGQGAPYAQFGYAAHIAVIEVDTGLGTVRPLRMIAAHDVGRAINPLLIEGQVEGGIAQGLGMALMEEYLPGRTENLHDYLIPTIGDVPPIETLIIEEADAHGPYGAKGLGEHALIPTAPAILNAIRAATGLSLRRVPVTPSRLRAALKER